MKCKDCRFWSQYCYTKDETRDCKRFPPVIIPETEGILDIQKLKYEFPRTHPFDWCGEFQPLTSN